MHQWIKALTCQCTGLPFRYRSMVTGDRRVGQKEVMQKTRCKWCQAEILIQTATRTNGRCIPCFRKKWYGCHLSDRFTRLIQKILKTPRQEEELEAIREEAKRWLSSSEKSLSWQSPRSFMETDWSRAESPAILFHDAHLGLMIQIESVITKMGGTSRRINAGQLCGFARMLEVDGAKFELNANTKGTSIRVSALPMIGDVDRQSLRVMRKVLLTLQDQIRRGQPVCAADG